MSRKFIILVISFVFALISSYKSESKDITAVSTNKIEQIIHDELEEPLPINSEYGIARQNSYSAPIRNLQPVKKNSNLTGLKRLIIKSGRNLCQQNIIRQYGYVSYYYPSNYKPDRMIVQLRKLVI